MIEANQGSTTAREDTYRLLAACYYPPKAELLVENCCENLAALLKAVAPGASQDAALAASLGRESSLESLAVEHARLFVGPFHLVAPPYGSVYLDDAKAVMGESTARVAAFYHSCGLQLAEDFPELPDHFAVELEFMYWLAFRQREAEAGGDDGEARRMVRLQQEFLARFLMPWLDPFTSAIIADGQAPFYQAVARCTAAFLHADHQALMALNV